MKLDEAQAHLAKMAENEDPTRAAPAAALLDLTLKAQIDHIRLLRVEQALAFLLRRQVVENKRRPAQGETVLPGVEFLIQQRTWLDEFNAEWQQTIENINAAKAANQEKPA